METDLKKLYFQIKEYIDMVDFSKLWKDFKPIKFALYNDNECFFDGNYINKTKDFIANTSILYNGEVIAIWNVMEYMDPIILTSKIIHEMYHGFQMINKETRFKDDIDALYNYKYQSENLGLKIKENQILVNLIEDFNYHKFEDFLMMRKYRYLNYNYEYDYEASIEQIEGTANYVELLTLKQLSFDLFQKKLSNMCRRITEKNNLFPIRIISYDVGAILLYIMNSNKIEFDTKFTSIPFSIEIIKEVNSMKFEYNHDIDEAINNYYKKAKIIIDNAVAKNDIICDQPSELLAVNIYDAIYCQNYIISNYFVMYGSLDKQNIKYGNFVVLTNKYKEATKIYLR